MGRLPGGMYGNIAASACGSASDVTQFSARAPQTCGRSHWRCHASPGVVLADGRFVRASTDEHSDLFWGLRGGGGGLGVLTRLEFALHPVRQVYAGVVVRLAEEAALLLRTFRDFTAEAPDGFCGLKRCGHQKLNNGSWVRSRVTWADAAGVQR